MTWHVCIYIYLRDVLNSKINQQGLVTLGNYLKLEVKDVCWLKRNIFLCQTNLLLFVTSLTRRWNVLQIETGHLSTLAVTTLNASFSSSWIVISLSWIVTVLTPRWNVVQIRVVSTLAVTTANTSPQPLIGWKLFNCPNFLLYHKFPTPPIV